MSDGCWVQYWDHDDFAGPTIRFDSEGHQRAVPDLDQYRQSDGAKAGNEPDSLKTGSRTWLVVYKDRDYGGRNAMFGPNSAIADLDIYDMGGNISSFKMYDSRPSWFVESARTSPDPAATELDGSIVDAQTVNNFVRTAVGVALGEIPMIGGAVSGLVTGLWPDKNNIDQVWASFQNYLNQAIAGVYWQTKYEGLGSTLQNIYAAADKFASTPAQDSGLKKDAFRNLYDLLGNTQSYFIDKQHPAGKYYFMVPYCTLYLATRREIYQNYGYYYGAEPSEQSREELLRDITDSIILFTQLLEDAKSEIIRRRTDESVIQVVEQKSGGFSLLDRYDGRSIYYYSGDSRLVRQTYADNIGNALALRLDVHNSITQLWAYFDPAKEVPRPVPPPTLKYATGPYGEYQQVEPFSKMADHGNITEVVLWTGGLVDGFELFVDGRGTGRVGGPGGAARSLQLEEQERVSVAGVYATRLINGLRFTSSAGWSVEGGTDEGASNRRHKAEPLEGCSDTRLIGLSGYAGVAPHDDPTRNNVKALTCHWACELPMNVPAK